MILTTYYHFLFVIIEKDISTSTNSDFILSSSITNDLNNEYILLSKSQGININTSSLTINNFNRSTIILIATKKTILIFIKIV